MRLPISVHTALHQGLELAAEIPCSRSGWHAWVWVRPILKCGKTLAQVQAEWTRTRLASRYDYDDTIERFEIRYAELSDWHLADEWATDLDLAIEQRPIVDNTTEVVDEAALVEVVSVWLSDL